MVGLMAAVAILMIFSTVGFQAWQDVVRRDREAEMMFRAQEIVRALRRYQKDQGTLPTELDALMKPGNRGQYFLRHKYADPLVKDGKWGLLFLAPGGGIYDPNAEEGSAGAGGEGGQATPGPLGQTPSRQGSRLNPTGGGIGETPGAAGQRPGTGLAGFGAGGAGEQGLPIAGVRTLCKDKPFRVFREQTEYDKWLFTVLDQDMPGAIPGQPGQPRVPGQPGMPGQPGAAGQGTQRPSWPSQPGVRRSPGAVGSTRTP
jgi:type II secretory pathway pseudopilin PulG